MKKQTTMEMRYRNFQLKSGLKTGHGEKREDTLDFIKKEISLALKTERQEVIEMIHNTLRNSKLETKLSGLVGEFGRDIIKAITKRNHE